MKVYDYETMANDAIQNVLEAGGLVVTKDNDPVANLREMAESLRRAANKIDLTIFESDIYMDSRESPVKYDKYLDYVMEETRG
jgi:hypothetical protein